MKKIIPSDSVLLPDEANRVFHGKIFEVYQWPQKVFDGTLHTFEMLKRPDTVTAICIVDDTVLVIDDEQPHLGSRKSFPGGRIDETDQTVESAAQREVHEETGYSFKNWRLVQVWQPYRKIEWFMYVLLAWEVVQKDQPHLDPGEKIHLQQIDFDTLKKLVADDVGYLGEYQALLKDIHTTPELLALSEYTGTIVDR